MLSRLLKSAEVGRLAGPRLLTRHFAAVKIRKSQITPIEEKEESSNLKQKKIVEKLGIVDQHVSALRENLGSNWLRQLDFETKVKPVLNKFKELGFTEDDLNVLARKWPDGLAINNNPEKKMDIFELTAHLGSKYGIKKPEQIREMVTTSREFLMISSQGLDERVERLANFLQLDKVIFYQEGTDLKGRRNYPKTGILPPKESSVVRKHT